MEEELVEKKKPSKLGKASLLLFIASIVIFIIAMKCDSWTFTSHRLDEILSWIAVYLYGISFLCALAVFPVSIIGIVKDRKIKWIQLCVVFLIIESILFISIGGFLFYIEYSGFFEATSAQMKKLQKIPEIEEFVITYDNGMPAHDGVIYNDYELYLTDNRFLKVDNLSEKMNSEDFQVEAIGQFSVCVQRKETKKLTLSDLSFLAGKEITNFQDVLDNYSIILSRLEKEPWIFDVGEPIEIKLSPIDKSKLAARENEFFADLQSMPHVVSVQKIDFYIEYETYYGYLIKIDDGNQFSLLLSTVKRDGDDYSCSFTVPSYNGKNTNKILSVRKNTVDGTRYYYTYSSDYFAHDTGIEVKSYRDLFYNYEAFKKSIENFIMATSE
ncbi:MAG: hypothetical protein J6U06_09045 [Spirochaetaceae bacterium]|nr:hypothetical protein [Spirochaetaceae bacterium]